MTKLDSINILQAAATNQIKALFEDADLSMAANIAVNMLFDILTANTAIEETITFTDFDAALATLNEKESRRKKDGVYYTLPDVSNFITYNTMLGFVHNNHKCVSTEECIEMVKSLSLRQKKCLLRSTVFDPTCGASEFLISAISVKLRLIEISKSVKDDRLILAIAKTLYGNDISEESIIISKVRIFFLLLPYLQDSRSFAQLSMILNKNFSCKDFVNVTNNSFQQFDIIIGNPPYNEYRNLDYIPTQKLYNTYANVIVNSIQFTTGNSSIGFIIPLSFVATPRMKKLRQYIFESFNYQTVLNYADRPDCLFAGVHQKLTILIAKQNNSTTATYTSSYHYWYKQERFNLFNRCGTQLYVGDYNQFIPKVGNEIELSIYEKCLARTNSYNILNCSTSNKQNLCQPIYLNMRNCFWIKAFSFNPGSSEYKRMMYPHEIADYILCVLNSSLFFFFWIVTSDCWHITSKELSRFYLPEHVSTPNVFTRLRRQLEDCLDKTKVYVGTKQTTYEYKHRFAKHIIDSIDDAIAEDYSLLPEEVSYIKNFMLKYRLSDGA